MSIRGGGKGKVKFAPQNPVVVDNPSIQRGCGRGREWPTLPEGSMITILGFGKAPSSWQCLCHCGEVFDARADNLIAGRTRSCGCLRKLAAKKVGSDRLGKPCPHYKNRPRSKKR